MARLIELKEEGKPRRGVRPLTLVLDEDIPLEDFAIFAAYVYEEHLRRSRIHKRVVIFGPCGNSYLLDVEGHHFQGRALFSVEKAEGPENTYIFRDLLAHIWGNAWSEEEVQRHRVTKDEKALIALNKPAVFARYRGQDIERRIIAGCKKRFQRYHSY
jgi:hypothetical protein